MSSAMQPRGPLPSRVYWTRRLVVLAAALLLVVGLARLFTTGSDPSSEASSDGTATTVNAGQDDSSESAGESAGERPSESTSEGSGAPEETESPQKQPSRTPLPAPEGECEASDIEVKPVVRRAYAGQDVRIRFRLRTREAEACTWEASPQTMTVKITSGDDDIWASSECPRVLPTQDVVLRSETGTTLEMAWNARRSDEECSRYTAWAMPGDYHVVAAALAGEPTDLQFSLEQAVSETITKTITPKPKNKDKRR